MDLTHEQYISGPLLLYNFSAFFFDMFSFDRNFRISDHETKLNSYFKWHSAERPA